MLDGGDKVGAGRVGKVGEFVEIDVFWTKVVRLFLARFSVAISKFGSAFGNKNCVNPTGLGIR